MPSVCTEFYPPDLIGNDSPLDVEGLGRVGRAIKTSVLFHRILFMPRAVYDPINFLSTSRDNEEIAEEAVGVAKLPVPRLTSRITVRRKYPLLLQQQEDDQRQEGPHVETIS